MKKARLSSFCAVSGRGTSVETESRFAAARGGKRGQEMAANGPEASLREIVETL